METSLEQQTKDYLSECEALDIVVKADYDVADVLITVGKDRENRVIEFFRATKKKAYDTWKTITAQENVYLAPIIKGRGIARKKQSNWLLEQERIAKKREDELKEKAKELGLDEEMVHVSVPVVKRGSGQREYWRYRLTDVPLTPDEIIHLFHSGYLIYNDAKIRKEVAEKKDKTDIAGVKAYKTFT